MKERVKPVLVELGPDFDGSLFRSRHVDTQVSERFFLAQLGGGLDPDIQRLAGVVRIYEKLDDVNWLPPNLTLAEIFPIYYWLIKNLGGKDASQEEPTDGQTWWFSDGEVEIMSLLMSKWQRMGNT